MSASIIGDEEVAQLHEQDGSPALAAIHRLTGDQAIRVLIAVRSLAPDTYREALAYAGVDTGEPAVPHRPTVPRYCSCGGPWPCSEAHAEHEEGGESQ